VYEINRKIFFLGRHFIFFWGGGGGVVILDLDKYEGKSLNNSNVIITFVQEYLQKLFVSYILT
jgi:hypothetical protein